MTEKRKIIHAQDVLKNPEQDLPECVFLKDTCVMAWSFDSMATAVDILAKKGYEAKTLWMSPQGNLCYVIMQRKT